jgi:hypothetical protein
MLISLLIGAVLAYSQRYDGTDAGYRTIGVAMLVNKLDAPPAEKGQRQLADVTIYPVFTQMVDNKPKSTVYVTGNELVPVNGKPGVGMYRPFQQVTDVPFKLTDGQAPSPNYTFLDYVKERQKDNPEIKYRLAWWAMPGANYAVWMGGAFLFIGILFPTFINVMIGAGYMPPPKPKEKPQPKPVYTHSGPEEEIEGLVKAKKGPMTAAEQQQLEELTAKLQQNVGGASVATGVAGSTTNTSTAPVKKLDTKPLEEVKTLEQPKEDVEWGGEFYPVAHAKHHSEEEKK